MKIGSLDLGDVWTGVALSDRSRIIARPYITIETKLLEQFLLNFFSKESISHIVLGYPKTMRGGESEQTRKVIARHEQLKKQFPAITWILWDERLTSKYAQKLQGHNKNKHKEHALAAAFILELYLNSCNFLTHNEENNQK